MGVGYFEIFDEDGVTEHNLPNQFFEKKHVGNFKVEAMTELLSNFSNSITNIRYKFYENEKLCQFVVVAPDSMTTRKTVWKQFKKQNQCKYYIEARMGAQVGQIYTIKKIDNVIKSRDKAFYEKTLYSDSKVEPLPCTEKTIIYNVAMISSWICRALKAIIMRENFPREITFNLTTIDERSLMIRK